MADQQQHGGEGKMEKSKETQKVVETLSVKESMVRKEIERRPWC